MTEIRIHGRFGQPIAQLAKEIGSYALEKGYEVQVFSAFSAIRPDAPNHSVVRIAKTKIMKRSEGQVNPDIVVVLDNSLFAKTNVCQGLKEGGKVMAYGVGADALGNDQKKYEFKALDTFFTENSEDILGNLMKALQSEGILL